MRKAGDWSINSFANNKKFQVCTMGIQIQGISDHWLLLKEEDRGVEFLGSNLKLI